MSETAQTNHTEKKDFLVRSSSLKDVRSFCREVMEKLQIDQNLKDELVLAIAEAAQNIVKHAYKNDPQTEDKMVVQITCKDNKLQIGFYDMGTPVDPNKVKHILLKRDKTKLQKEKKLDLVTNNLFNPNKILLRKIGKLGNSMGKKTYKREW